MNTIGGPLGLAIVGTVVLGPEHRSGHYHVSDSLSCRRQAGAKTTSDGDTVLIPGGMCNWLRQSSWPHTNVSVIGAAFQLSGMTISEGSIDIDSVNRTAGISGGDNYYSNDIALEAGVPYPPPITPRNVLVSPMAYRR